MANNLASGKRVQILRMLAEGNSVRSTARLVGSQHRTVLRHLAIAGEQCRQFLHNNLVEIKATHVQCDEIWTFCRKKQARVLPGESDFEIGDQYVYIAFDQPTKLICTYAIGKRDGATTQRFIDDLARRIDLPDYAHEATQPQLSTDGWPAYPDAITASFGRRVKYGQLIKTYGDNPNAGRYAPSGMVSIDRRPWWGGLDPKSICTSHVERNNLTIRTFARRFARLSLSFSKKLANLKAAVALHVFHYNFCRIHSSLKRTPAMAAGVTERLWRVQDLLG